MPLDENDLDYIDAAIKTEVLTAKTEFWTALQRLSHRIDTLWSVLFTLVITQMVINFVLYRWIMTLKAIIMMPR